MPGDLDKGVAYRCEVGFDENGRADAGFGLGCSCGNVEAGSPLILVVIVLAPDEVTVAAVVETCAAATSDPGDTASYAEVDFAWKAGLVRARKEEKKLAKKGRLVGMVSTNLAVWVAAPDSTDGSMLRCGLTR